MISEIKDFLEEFFQAELDARNSTSIPDLDNMNNKIRKMYTYCSEALHFCFGIIPEKSLKDPEYYEERKGFKHEHPRFLFKISHYRNKIYKDLFLAYTTSSVPMSAKYLKISKCLFIGKQAGEYKILNYYFVNNEYPDRIHWVKVEGQIHSPTFEDAGEFVKAERYLEPTYNKRSVEDYEFSMQEYQADK